MVKSKSVFVKDFGSQGKTTIPFPFGVWDCPITPDPWPIQMFPIFILRITPLIVVVDSNYCLICILLLLTNTQDPWCLQHVFNILKKIWDGGSLGFNIIRQYLPHEPVRERDIPCSIVTGYSRRDKVTDRPDLETCWHLNDVPLTLSPLCQVLLVRLGGYIVNLCAVFFPFFFLKNEDVSK